MRAVVQRVREAAVTVEGAVVSRIGHGLLVYLGVAAGDGEADVAYVADKVRHLRIFPESTNCEVNIDDPQRSVPQSRGRRMNADVAGVGGTILVVSAFSLQADARRGRRPSFQDAASPDEADNLYQQFCATLVRSGVPVQRGSFGSMMDVRSVAAGPVCILLDSTKNF